MFNFLFQFIFGWAKQYWGVCKTRSITNRSRCFQSKLNFLLSHCVSIVEGIMVDNKRTFWQINILRSWKLQCMSEICLKQKLGHFGYSIIDWKLEYYILHLRYINHESVSNINPFGTQVGLNKNNHRWNFWNNYGYNKMQFC